MVFINELDKGKEDNERFLKVLKFAFSYGMFGVHRLILKKFFSGSLYILSVLFFVIYFLFLRNYFDAVFLIFINIMILFVFYLKDIIYLVTNRFKDKNGEVISYSIDTSKKEDFNYNGHIIKKEGVSDLDYNLLYRLTSDKIDFSGIFGAYHFYAGNKLKGFLNVGLFFLFLVTCFFIRIYFLLAFTLGFSLSIFLQFKIYYDKRTIKQRRYKDSKGKIVCFCYSNFDNSYYDLV